MSVRYEELREIAAHSYFGWLDSLGVLEKFERPETIEMVSYELGYPDTSVKMFEKIFSFLLTFDILEEAGSTFKLKYDLASTRTQWSKPVDMYRKNPIYHFMKLGLRLLSDILEGGTGSWDPKLHHYVIESTLAHKSLNLTNSAIFQLDLLDRYFSKPKIAMYCLFPQTSLGMYVESIPNYSDIHIICPTEEARKQIISYCEFHPPARQFSTKVIPQDQIVHETFDILLVPNGMTYRQNLKLKLKFFNRILNNNGFVFFENRYDPKFQLGIEPLLELHSNFYPFVDHKILDQTLKTTGFAESKPSYDSYLYTKKVE